MLYINQGEYQGERQKNDRQTFRKTTRYLYGQQEGFSDRKTDYQGKRQK